MVSEKQIEKFKESFLKDFGAGSLHDATEIVTPDAISTGSIGLDDATGIGGYPEGRMTELWGQDDIGKRLDINTPIPTPDGWTTMGNLKKGDRVFDRFGRPCNVVYVSPIRSDTQARRIHFGNDVFIDADVDHQWIASKRSSRNKWQVVTTGEMEQQTVINKKNGDRLMNWAIPVTEAVQYEDKIQLIDPYILGYWLGDGNTDNDGITISYEDSPHLEHSLEEAGFKWTAPHCYDKENSHRITPLLLRPMLKEIGVLGYKHIPNDYLQGSIEQRVALLQGLMDSDGSINQKSRMEICLSDKTLILNVRELVSSLGCKPSRITEGIGSYRDSNGLLIECKTKYRLSFQSDFNPFRLARKADVWEVPVTQRYKRRFVNRIEKIDSIPMRCIQVDSPDNSYLAGEDYVVTHNTTMALMAVSEAQRKYPDRVVAWVDVENKLDKPWAEKHGVDLSRLWVYVPETAEETADAVARFLSANFVSMLVVDSIGAMIGRVEMEKNAEDSTVAIVARIVTRMVRAANSQAKHGNPAVILINQIRANIGGYGSATTRPGGWALKFQTTMRIKLATTAKQPYKTKVDGDDIEVAREIAATVERNKCAPKGRSAMITLVSVATPKYGPVGVDKAAEAFEVCKAKGLIVQGGAWYTLPNGERFQGGDPVVDYLHNNPEYVEELRQMLIDQHSHELTNDLGENEDEVEVAILAPLDEPKIPRDKGQFRKGKVEIDG